MRRGKRMNERRMPSAWVNRWYDNDVPALPCPSQWEYQHNHIAVSKRVVMIIAQGHGLCLLTWRMSNVANAKSAFDMKMQSEKWNHDPAATAASRVSLRLGHNRRWRSSSLWMVIRVVSLCTAVCPHKFSINASFHWYVETRNAACHKHHKLRKTFCKIMWEKCGVLICLRNVRIPWPRKV